MAVVGAPSYFATRAIPLTPHDLTGHVCINVSQPTYGGLYVREFKEGGRELDVRFGGQLVVNGMKQVSTAALAGAGLAFTLEDAVQELLTRGAWCGCSKPGVHALPGIIFTTQAAAKPHRRLPWCATHCGRCSGSTSFGCKLQLT
jgi:DNA-binding transcriptional LysR family regulator